MKGDGLSTRRRVVLILTGLITIGVLGLVWIDRNYFPSRGEITMINPGMTKDEVTSLLGVLYDETRPGEHAEIDRVLKERDGANDAASIMIYRISGSRDTAWILCGADGRVIERWIGE